MKFIGRIGSGQVVHSMIKSVRPEDNNVMYFTDCGSDHATNRGMLRTKLLGELDLTKVTCKKCLNKNKV